MAAEVFLLPRAEKELAELPESTQSQIIAKLDLLGEFPEMGPAMVDAFSGYRALLAARNRYRLIYRIVSPDRIDVAYIRQCTRQTGLRAVLSGTSHGGGGGTVAGK